MPEQVTVPKSVCVPEEVPVTTYTTACVPEQVMVPKTVIVPEQVTITVPKAVCTQEAVTVPREVVVPQQSSVTVPKQVIVPEQVTVPKSVCVPEEVPVTTYTTACVPEQVPVQVPAVAYQPSTTMVPQTKTMCIGSAEMAGMMGGAWPEPPARHRARARLRACTVGRSSERREQPVPLVPEPGWSRDKPVR